MRRMLFVSFVIFLLSSTALAQQNQQAVAKQHFDVAEGAYKKGDYSSAVKEYLSAYQIAPYNALLFNIGQAYRMQGDKEKALAYYEKYVEFEPAGVSIPEAKDHIAELKVSVETASKEKQMQEEEAARLKAEEDAKRSAEDAKLKAAQDSKSREQAESAGSGLRIGGIVLGAVGVGAVAAGIALAAGDNTGAGIGIAGAGVACIGGGIGMYIVGRNQRNDALSKAGVSAMIVPAVVPGFYGAAFAGSF